MILTNFIDPRSGEQVAVRDIKAAPENPWAYPTHMAVGPQGQMVFRHMTPDNLKDIGDVPIKSLSGHAVLDPAYVRRGWVMYEDLCAGRVAGVEADPDAWTRWQSLIAYHKAGRVLPKQLRDDDKLFHPEVARRRLAGGVAQLPSVDEFKSAFPGMVFDDEAEVDKPAPKSNRKAAG